jgi:hypothetical protein
MAKIEVGWRRTGVERCVPTGDVTVEHELIAPDMTALRGGLRVVIDREALDAILERLGAEKTPEARQKLAESVLPPLMVSVFTKEEPAPAPEPPPERQDVVVNAEGCIARMAQPRSP